VGTYWETDMVASDSKLVSQLEIGSGAVAMRYEPRR
jgi:hypothetical protein